MPAMTVFYQNCPVCGRSLRVSIRYFGRQMLCSHCHGEFQAGASDMPADKPLAIEPETPATLPVAYAAPLLGEMTAAGPPGCAGHDRN